MITKASWICFSVVPRRVVWIFRLTSRSAASCLGFRSVCLDDLALAVDEMAGIAMKFLPKHPINNSFRKTFLNSTIRSNPCLDVLFLTWIHHWKQPPACMSSVTCSLYPKDPRLQITTQHSQLSWQAWLNCKFDQDQPGEKRNCFTP